jgi:DNA-binding GntR family transcriptional regulator
MPEVPVGVDQDGAFQVPTREVAPEDAAPYQRIAADLRAAIQCGALQSGGLLPTIADLATRYEVAVGTAHRAVAMLVAAGLATASRGRRAVVV